MITMGYLGDRIGRRRGMVATQALVVVGALSSALLTWGPPKDVYAILAACRFVLGVRKGSIRRTQCAAPSTPVVLGCTPLLVPHPPPPVGVQWGVGGIYPMSAAMTHEAGAKNDNEADGGAGEHAEHNAAQSRVGWAFFWQVRAWAAMRRSPCPTTHPTLPAPAVTRGHAAIRARHPSARGTARLGV